MITDDGMIVCDEPYCGVEIKNNRWAKTKAEGWFFAKTGAAWCPAHLPAWHAEWKRRSS